MLASAGYNPNDMANFFETLEKQSRFSAHNIPEFLLTHPVTISRIADTRGRAASYKYAPQQKPSKSQPSAFQLLQVRLSVLATNNEQQKELIRDFEKSLTKIEKVNHLKLYEMALRYQQQSNYDESRKLLKILLKSDPQRLAYILAAAENEIDAKNYSAAIDLLQNPILIYPNNLALTTLDAKASLLNNDVQTATRLLENQIRSGRFIPETFKLLANAEQKAGRTSEAYEALGNYYLYMGEINTSIKHFEEALQKTNNDSFRELRLKAIIKQLKGDLVSNRTTE